MCSLGQYLHIVCPVGHRNNPTPSPCGVKNVRDYPHLSLNRGKIKEYMGNDRKKSSLREGSEIGG